MKQHFDHATLIGVGLIGGSLARDLRRLGLVRGVTGFSRTPANLRYALNHKVITHIGGSLKRELERSDLVILAEPVEALLKRLPVVARLARPNALVIDVGSTKGAIVDRAERLFKASNFVGCHPMAGREVSGVRASLLGLFKGKTTVITPGKGTRRAMIARARALWTAVGARVVVMSAKEHDQRVALSSHLPQLIASTLMNVAARQARLKDLARCLGNGFRDTTRIAASDAGMWREIFSQNRRHLVALIAAFQTQLARVKTAIEQKNNATVFDFMQTAANHRRRLK